MRYYRFNIPMTSHKRQLDYHSTFLLIGVLIPALLLISAPTALAGQSPTQICNGQVVPHGAGHCTGGKIGTTKQSSGTSRNDSRHHSGSSSLSTGSSRRGLVQIPSNATDFPNNDANVIQVHVTSAKKDIIGSYHVTGEITNKGNDTLSTVLVTVHFYDARGNLVADSTCCYTTPTDIAPSHTATFDSFVMSNQISGTPANYRLSYDWSAPTVTQTSTTGKQTPSQSTTNFTAGNMTSAVSKPIFGSGLRNVLKQIPSTAADYPNNDPKSLQFLDVKALKGGEFNYVYITGTLLSLSNKTLYNPAPIVYLFDKNNQPVGEATNGLFVSSELPPHTSGTFNVDIDPSMLKAEPTSYQLRFEGTFQ